MRLRGVQTPPHLLKETPGAPPKPTFICLHAGSQTMNQAKKLNPVLQAGPSCPTHSQPQPRMRHREKDGEGSLQPEPQLYLQSGKTTPGPAEPH